MDFDNFPVEVNPVPVPRSVAIAYERVRRTGRINMFDHKGFVDTCRAMSMNEAAAWAEAHPNLYAHIPVHGMEIEDPNA